MFTSITLELDVRLWLRYHSPTKQVIDLSNADRVQAVYKLRSLHLPSEFKQNFWGQKLKVPLSASLTGLSPDSKPAAESHSFIANESN